MIKNVAALIALGAASLGLAAQEGESRPFYVGFTTGFSQADLRYYQGGKVLGQSYELGYDATKPDNFTGMRIYGRYSRWTGEHSESLDVTQDLISYGAGFEFTFQTPVRNLRPYVGAMFTFWDGKRVTDSAYLGYMQARYQNVPEAQARERIMLAGPNREGNGKLGIRFGVGYTAFDKIGISLDYNVSQWLNEYELSANPKISNYPVKGFNRVNPSWIGLTIKYHFGMSF
jgi:hypothetical protein